MISHCVVRGSATSVAEYLGSSPAKYYSGEDPRTTFVVTPEPFLSLLKEKGLDKKDQLINRLAYFSGRKRVGTDFTFSLGKEVSLLVVKDEKVLKEVREEVARTVWRMQNYVYTRVTKDGERRYVKAKALVHVLQHWARMFENYLIGI